MQHLIYIGRNRKNMASYAHSPQRKIYHTANYRRAIAHVEGIKDIDSIAVFFEYTNADDDIPRIEMTRKRFPAIYIALVAKKPGETEILRYLRAGINNSVSGSAPTQTIDDIYRYIERRSGAAIREAGRKEKVRKFVLPVWKRCFDILFSLAALTVLSPLLLVTALAIRIESRGPVIYKSKRVGSNYRIFDFLKFRSMHIGADERLRDFSNLNQYRTGEDAGGERGETAGENGDVVLVSDDYTISERDYIDRKSREQKNSFVKLENDPRTTKTGRIIRKYSIDELPQLINILRGEMSVVGNRPLPLYEAELLTNDEYIDRFMAPAGLTGLWQVEKRGDPGRLSAEERKQLDITYARTFSFRLDIRIIFRTIIAFVQKEDV